MRSLQNFQLGPLTTVTMSEKLHTAVKPRTFGSKEYQDTFAPERFKTLPCGKNAVCNGAPHIRMSNWQNTKFGKKATCI